MEKKGDERGERERGKEERKDILEGGHCLFDATLEGITPILEKTNGTGGSYIQIFKDHVRRNEVRLNKTMDKTMIAGNSI